MSVDDVRFDPALIVEVLERHGVASLDDIIESKEVAARAKDDEALPELRALAERQSGG